MKKGGTTATSHKKETGGASTSAHPTRTDAPMSKAEVTATVEKTVADAFARQKSDFQTAITKSTKQEVHNVSDRLKELGDRSLDANAKNLKRFEEVEDTLRDLRQRFVLLEKLVKEELSGIIEEKVQLTLHKNHPESEVEKEKGKWSEQLASNDSAHQQEIQKLHQQHHQDMLSVINDCCQKLKSSFTRQRKPYEVVEIHAVIDDVEQKMIREILSEIEKTDIHEDLSAFEEALVTSDVSAEVSQGRDLTRLTSDEITASLDAFERDNMGSFSEELESAAAAVEDERRPVVEEDISSSRSMITGDRGNIYYSEELKRTVDDIIASDEKTGTKPNEGESAPDLPPKTKNYQDVEESLESLIISGDAERRPFEEELESLISKDQEEKEKAVVKDVKLGGEGKTSDVLPETTSHDPDRLKTLEAMVEGDISWADILQPPSKRDEDQSKSNEAVIDPFTTTPATSTRDQDFAKPPEGKLDTIAPALSPKDHGKPKSLEGKVEPKPSAKSAQDQKKSGEVVIDPFATTPATLTRDQDLAKSLEGKLEPKPSAKSAQDQRKSGEVVTGPFTATPATLTRDQDLSKSLEGKLEPKPSAKSAQGEIKPGEVVIDPFHTTPATTTQDQDLIKSLEDMLESDTGAFSPGDLDKLKSFEGKLEPPPSAESALDVDQMKSLEAMLEAQMTDSPDTAGRSISHGHIETTNSARQQVKASLPEQVTASAFQPTETMNVAPRTGFDENPHYVEEVIHAATSAAKEKP